MHFWGKVCGNGCHGNICKVSKSIYLSTSYYLLWFLPLLHHCRVFWRPCPQRGTCWWRAPRWWWCCWRAAPWWRAWCPSCSSSPSDPSPPWLQLGQGGWAAVVRGLSSASNFLPVTDHSCLVPGVPWLLSGANYVLQYCDNWRLLLVSCVATLEWSQAGHSKQEKFPFPAQLLICLTTTPLLLDTSIQWQRPSSLIKTV